LVFGFGFLVGSLVVGLGSLVFGWVADRLFLVVFGDAARAIIRMTFSPRLLASGSLVAALASLVGLNQKPRRG
jgi:hypothetical protein